MKIFVTLACLVGFSIGVYFALKINSVEIKSTKNQADLTPYQRKLYEQYYKFK
jgi:hypothetical protein